MTDRPKYSLIENEKRWLLNKELLPDVTVLEKIEITDKYFPGTRIRLRKMVNTLTAKTVYKLTKKYGKISGNSEPLTTIYLTFDEFKLYNNLHGNELRKIIYRYPYLGKIFLIEFFLFPETGFILGEAEASSEEELERLVLPEFILQEVTSEKTYEGYTIAANISGK